MFQQLKWQKMSSLAQALLSGTTETLGKSLCFPIKAGHQKLQICKTVNKPFLNYIEKKPLWHDVRRIFRQGSLDLARQDAYSEE